MSKQRPRPVREAARHPIHPDLPAPSRQPRGPEQVLLSHDQKRRLADLLQGACQMDELASMRDYVQRCMRFPAVALWIDPDVELARPLPVCCLVLKEEYDRRGILVKCSVEGFDQTRFIPLEQLRGRAAVVDDANWDAEDAQKVAARIIDDYRFWVDELHGLDPSEAGFYGGPEDDYDMDGGGGSGGGMDMFGMHGYDGSYYSDDEEDSAGDEMLFGDEDFEDLSSGALAELEGHHEGGMIGLIHSGGLGSGDGEA